MADDTNCDVVSNGEVFVDDDSDPNSILQNVEQTCSKILIPSMAHVSMAQSSMSKLSGSDRDVGPDVIFSTLKEVNDHDHDSPGHQNDDDHDHEHEGTNIVIKTDVDDKRNIRLGNNNVPGQARVVKWTLETMAMAMDSVLCGKMTTTNAARKFGIPRTTLLDRLAMKVKRQHIETPGSFPLSADNTAKIVDFIRKNADCDKATLLKGILAMAEDLAREQGKPFDNPLVTRKWLKLFVHKHPSLDILKFSRPRNTSQSSQRSPVTITPLVRGNSTPNNNNEVLLSPHIIHIQQSNNGHHSSPHEHEVELVNEHEDHDADSTQSNNMHAMQQIYDSFESNLARLAAEAVERKLNSEQCSYFNYRFYNNAIERGYELWKLCKSKADLSSASDQENFETVLSAQALVAIEQALVPEHLKYFRFRYENQDLEEGYKLWSVLKEKSHSQG